MLLIKQRIGWDHSTKASAAAEVTKSGGGGTPQKKRKKLNSIPIVGGKSGFKAPQKRPFGG